MEIIRFSVGDRIRLKKKHPCGNDIFTVARGGTDVRIICAVCSRDITVERSSLEKMIRTVIPGSVKGN